ncbi:MAG: phage holin family protein [Nitriliruptoraceae bacterium]|nr:phage holin family protein [Nitriliruptoraceae bacterium]
MGIVIRVLINAAALWVAVTLLDGFDFEFGDGSIPAFLVIALILGVVNVIVRPILTVLSLPAIVLTLGLFLLVVNAIVLALVVAISGALDLGLVSDGFGWTFLAAIIMSLVSWGLETLLGRG